MIATPCFRTPTAVLAAALLLLAPAGTAQQVVPLWAQGAPGFESRKDEPEKIEQWSVRNIHHPSVTIHLPAKEKATGMGIVVVPGGGHSKLVFGPEGSEPAKWLVERGIAAFVLKHRLAREEGSPYKIDIHARQDGQRAMRLVRTRAAEWGVDPARLGMMGFSAGGEVLQLVAYSPAGGDAAAPDPVDRASARPDFLVNIYPGPAGLPEKVAPDAPPAFLLCSDDDRSHAWVVTRLLQLHREARRPVECHLLAKGGHGFNMGAKSKFASVRGWPARLEEWLADGGAAPAAPTQPEPPRGAAATAALPAAATPGQEAAFAQLLQKAVLTGRWCFVEESGPGEEKSDTYHIEKAIKLPSGNWAITARFDYGGQEVAFPIPVKLDWAGGSPVIVVDNLPIPGGGTYSARLILHEGTYAGTWSGGGKAGLMNGVIKKAP